MTKKEFLNRLADLMERAGVHGIGTNRCDEGTIWLGDGERIEFSGGAVEARECREIADDLDQPKTLEEVFAMARMI
jgi:uncharacterized membrane protein